MRAQKVIRREEQCTIMVAEMGKGVRRLLGGRRQGGAGALRGSKGKVGDSRLGL